MDPITWVYLIVMVVMAVLAYTMMPKPASQKPPALSEFSVPTAQEGRDITMIFGTVWIDDPNIVNYGALTLRPIYADSGK